MNIKIQTVQSNETATAVITFNKRVKWRGNKVRTWFSSSSSTNYLQTNIAVTQIRGGRNGRVSILHGRSVGIRVTWTRDFLAHFPRLLIDVTNERLSHTPPRKTRALHHSRRNGCTLLTLLQLHQLRLIVAFPPLLCSPLDVTVTIMHDNVARDETKFITLMTSMATI